MRVNFLNTDIFIDDANITSSSTIGEVKESIFKKYGQPPETQDILLAGESLPDTDTILQHINPILEGRLRVEQKGAILPPMTTDITQLTILTPMTTDITQLTILERIDKNPLSDVSILLILGRIRPGSDMPNDAILQVRALIIPIENGLGPLNTPQDIERFIQENLTDQLAIHALAEYHKSNRKSSIVEYLVMEVLDKSSNMARYLEKETISQRHVILAVGNNNNLLGTLKANIPLFVHYPPEIAQVERIFVINKERFDLPGRQLSDDYRDGLYNLMIAIVNHYYRIPQLEILQAAQAVSQRSGRGILSPLMVGRAILLLQDQILRTIMAYSMVLQPTGEMTYAILMSAAMANPYLEDIPMIQIVQENSEIAKAIYRMG